MIYHRIENVTEDEGFAPKVSFHKYQKKREHEIGDDKKRMLRRNVPFVTKTST